MRDGDQDNIEEILPLLPSQQGMLLSVLRGDAPPGTLVGVMRFDLHTAATEEQIANAIRALVKQHPALRSSFIWKDVTRPLQAIHQDCDVPIVIKNWSKKTQADQSAAIASHSELQKKAAFDLSNPPLVRVTLARLSDDRFCVIWALHHLICDGWSANVLVKGLLTLLEAKELPEDKGLKRSLVWHKRQDQQKGEVFWRSYLQGIEPAAELSAGAAQPSFVAQARSILSVPVPPEIDAKARSFAKELRMSFPTLLSAVYGLVLRRYGAGNDVVFGLANAGRPAAIPGIAQAVGAFVNTLPLRVEINPEASVRQWLVRVSQSFETRREFEHSALDRVVNQSPVSNGHELFNTMFAFEGLPEGRSSGAENSVSALEVTSPSEHSLATLYYPGPAPGLAIYYDTARLGEAWVTKFASDFVTIMNCICDDADLPIRQAICAAFPLDPPEPSPAFQHSNVVEAICAHAATNPSGVAVAGPDSQITYGALEARSAALACAMRSRGVGAGSIVPIAASRGVGAIVAMIAVLRAGAAYVPLDMSYPPARIRAILTNCDASLCLTDQANHWALGKGVEALDITQDSQADAPDLADLPSVQNTDLAYVLYTSGSTGAPKGVKISHGNLSYSTFVRDHVYPQGPDAFLMLSSLAFDSSVVGIFWTLSHGGTLHLSPESTGLDPRAIATWIAERQIDYCLCLPSLFRTVLLAANPEQIQNLKCAIVAGEALSDHIVELHREAAPHTTLFNEYGPTEGTVWCATYNATKHRGDPVPIGTPPQGTSLEVIDPDGAGLSDGAVGELAIAGPGVFQGYWNAPQTTDAAYLTSGMDRACQFYKTGDLGYRDARGQMVFLGRKDDQVKIRGQRVELAEIQSAVMEVSDAKDVFAFAAGDKSGQKIVCAIEVGQVASAQIRRRLASILPDYMVPGTIIGLENLPKLPNGKVDKKALLELAEKERTRTEKSGEPLTTKTERTLAEIWCQELGQDSVDASASFFDLGGDSLKSIHVMLAAEKRGLSVQPFEIFEHPVLRDLARHIDEADSGTAVDGHSLLSVSNPRAKGSSFLMVHGSVQLSAGLKGALGPSRRLIHQLPANLGKNQSVGSVLGETDRLLERYLAMQPNGPYFLGGYSAGAIIAVEVARKLRALTGAPPFLFLIDPSWETGTGNPDANLIGSLKTGSNRMALRAVTGLRLASLAARRTMNPNDEQVAGGIISNQTRRALLKHRMQPYDGPVKVVLSTEGAKLDSQSEWLDAIFSDLERHAVPFSHMQLQSQTQAIEMWTKHLLADLKTAEDTAWTFL